MDKVLRNPASVLILTRLWQMGAGVVSVILVVKELSLPLQGYYYTFLGLTGIQSFFELGIYIVITNFAAHEWVHLYIDENRQVKGDSYHLIRLAGLINFSSTWYLAISICYLVAALFAGYWLFYSSASMAYSNWIGPYAVTIIGSSISLWMMPKLSLLEACGKIYNVQLLRLLQAIFSNISLWYCLLAGFELWSVAVAHVISTSVVGHFIFRRNHLFFSSLSNYGTGLLQTSWFKEIWPMQWPIAVQGLLSFFITSYLVPITFRFQGPIAAGKIGLSWQIVQAFQSLASAWPQVNVPRFAHAAAQGQRQRMNKVWRKNMLLSVSSYILTSVILIFSILFIPHSFRNYVDRLVPITAMGYLLCAGLVSVISVNLSVYWRAYKMEPVGLYGALPGLVAAVSLYLAARLGGPEEISIAYVLTLFFVNLPISYWAWWSVFRKYSEQ